MTVVLEPPLGHYAAWGHVLTPLVTGPRYVRSASGTYWHRPRSGVDREGRIVYAAWCGPSVYVRDGFASAEDLPKQATRCATCEGRAAGAGQDEWTGDGTVMFSPRRLTPPKRCPGSRTKWCEELSWNVGRCLVCGVVTPMRASGGAYNPRWGMTNHPPGPDLVAGCPFHAWRELELKDGRASCGCGRPGTTRNDPGRPGTDPDVTEHHRPLQDADGHARTGADDA